MSYASYSEREDSSGFLGTIYRWWEKDRSQLRRYHLSMAKGGPR